MPSYLAHFARDQVDHHLAPRIVAIEIEQTAHPPIQFFVGALRIVEFVGMNLVENPALVLADPAAVTPTFVVDRAGKYVVQLVVNDGVSSSTPDTVVINTVNSRPV